MAQSDTITLITGETMTVDEYMTAYRELLRMRELHPNRYEQLMDEVEEELGDELDEELDDEEF